MEDIARAADMSTGLLFHYFSSKEDLYEELIRRGSAAPLRVLADVESDPVSLLEDVAHRVIESIRERPFVAQMFVLMSQALVSEATPPGARAILDEFDVYTPTVALLQRGQASGAVQSGDPLALAVVFWAAIQGVAQQLVANPALPSPRADWIVEMIRSR